jgi:hypothetical protein
MSYLGNAPARSFISFERQVFSIVNSQTAYALSHSVTNENDIRLVVNNVVQEPGSGKAYTATGTALTLSAALTNGTDEMYCVFLGRATATSAPGAGSIGTAQLASDSVTLAKMASGTDGNIISYDASGNPVAVATGNDGQVLTSAGAGAPPVFETPASATNTPAFQVYLSNEPAIATGTWTKCPFNVERYDVGGCYNTSNYRFTPTTAGKYVFYVQVGINSIADGKYMYASLYKNGSTLWGSANAINYAGAAGGFASRYTITAEANGSSDYFEGYAYHNHGSNRDFTAGWSFFGGYKIIE